MFNNLIVIHTANSVTGSMDTSVPLAERLKSGAETLFLGMITVFAVLIVIWLILELSSWIFSHDFRKKDAAKSNDAKKEISSDSAGDADINEDDGRLAAVISAAVAAYIDAERKDGDAEKTEPAFKVVSFKRLG